LLPPWSQILPPARTWSNEAFHTLVVEVVMALLPLPLPSAAAAAAAAAAAGPTTTMLGFSLLLLLFFLPREAVTRFPL
jgi:hypothetical protein